MHELGIVFHVIKSVEQIAAENQVDVVSAVTLEIGEVSGIVHSYILDCWRFAADRSEVMKGSELKIEEIHAVTHCEACKRDYDTVAHGRFCPTNFIATPKVCIVRYRREEGIAKSQPYGQKSDNKAYMAGKLAKNNEALKIAVNRMRKSGG